MTTLIRPHTISLNNALNQVTGAAQIAAWGFAVKQFLTGAAPVDPVGAHTIVASSNGTVATAGDNIASAADIIAAAAGTAHSWFITEDPNGAQFLFDFSGAVLTEQVRIAVARQDQHFSVAGLSTLNAPANPANAIQQPTDSYRQILENNPSVFNHTLHLWRDSIGSFVIGTARAGVGRVDSGIAWLVLDTTDAEVTAYPYYFMQVYVSGAGGAFGRGVLDNGSSYMAANAWRSDGTTVAAIIDQRNVASVSGATGTISGRLPRHRIEVWNNVSGFIAYRGSVPDLGVIAGAPTSNDLEPGADAVRRIVLGTWDMLTLGGTTLTL